MGGGREVGGWALGWEMAILSVESKDTKSPISWIFKNIGSAFNIFKHDQTDLEHFPARALLFFGFRNFELLTHQTVGHDFLCFLI